MCRLLRFSALVSLLGSYAFLLVSAGCGVKGDPVPYLNSHPLPASSEADKPPVDSSEKAVTQPEDPRKEAPESPTAAPTPPAAAPAVPAVSPEPTKSAPAKAKSKRRR